MCNRNRIIKLTIVATMCMAYRLPLLALNPDTLLARASGPDSLLTRSYDFVSRSDGWFRTHNAAALTRFRSDNISQAELTVSHAHGGLVDYYQSPSTLNVTAAVQSLSRISRRTVVYGAISYRPYKKAVRHRRRLADQSRTQASRHLPPHRRSGHRPL